MLEKIKTILLISDASKDGLITQLIELATDEALSYTHVDEANKSSLDSVVIQMVVEKYNKLGGEGLGSRSLGGVSENYTDGYSANVIKLLNSKRKLRTI